MNTRTFLASLVAIAACPWSVFRRKDNKPLLRQVFPKTPAELLGVYCKNIYDTQVYPYRIIREFDHFKDQWEGQWIDNCRRNKWWAEQVDGKTVLICTGSRFNDPETLFFKKI